MIIKCKNKLPVLSSDSDTEYAVLPLMTGVLFPGMTLTVHVARQENIKVIRQYQSTRKPFISAYAHSEVESEGWPPIHQVGVLTVVRDIRKGPAGSLRVTLEGLKRIALKSISATEPHLKATANELQEQPYVGSTVKQKMDEAISIISELTHLDPMYSPEILNVVKISSDEPSQLADTVAANFHFTPAAKQEILDAAHLKKRFDRLIYFLNGELNRVATALSIDEKVKQRIEEDQHRYYLKQQLFEIKRQLGEDNAEQMEVARFRSLLKNRVGLPKDVANAARIETERLGQVSPASAEFGVTKNYLEWLLGIPWGRYRSEDFDMREAEKVLFSEYYGPKSLKEQVLQRISIRKLALGVDESPTLCLIGAPGTGKASLAKAIARALNKELVRISVGGITDVDDIKGTTRSFLGAFPGRIVRALKEIETANPVVLIEDIDYFNVDNDASVNMALLEAIDSRRNSRFLDNYIGVPFDLSRALFICSVRSFEEIPEQFVPRLEIVELPGYIEKEKVAIAKKHMIPDMLKQHGLLKSEFRISDRVLGRIISSYTQEAGLLGLSQQIAKIARKIALEKAETGKVTVRVTEKDLDKYLGAAIFIPEKAETAPEIGIATGLAWTGSGGELMFIEGLKMKGDGQITTTGSLGDVMRESVQAAHSYVRSKADMLGIDYSDFNDFDIHIHFPSGAIPKDGPSAGATVSLVIASVMSERPIRNDIAMTGEVTLRGRVLAVGGVKEKISAAYRTGIFNVALPKENEKDVKELPDEILRKAKFHYIERVDELFELCLMDYTPSTFTLEKVFAEEIQKAKGRQSKKKPGARKPRPTPASAGKSKPE